MGTIGMDARSGALGKSASRDLSAEIAPECRIEREYWRATIFSLVSYRLGKKAMPQETWATHAADPFGLMAIWQAGEESQS